MTQSANEKRTDKFMRTIFFIGFCVLFLIGVPVPIGHASDAFPYALGADLETTTNPYRITVDTSSARPLNQKVYGFNTNHTTSSNMYSSANVIEGTGQLRPGILRFPGGTVGNWYQWRTDDFWGYGPTAPSFATRCEVYREQNRIYGWDGYVSLVRRYNMEPIIMVNILSQRPEDAAAWFDYMESIDFPVRYAELGNENMLQGQGSGSIYNLEEVSEYIRVTKLFAAAIRENHPEIKIGVNVCKRHRDWYDAIAEETYYDAVIDHQYVGYGVAEWNSTAVKTFLGGEKIVSELASEWINTFNKPIWITEWNQRCWSDATPFFAGSAAVAIYTASMYMRMLDYPDVIEVACLHKDYGNPDYAPYSDTTKRAMFPVWRLIGAATRDCTQILETTISPCNRTDWDFQMSNVKAFRGDGAVHLLVVNKLPVAKDVEIVIDGNRWTGGGEATWVSFARLSAKPTVSLSGTFLESASFGQTAQVKAYSVTHIVVDDQGIPGTDTVEPTGRIIEPATGATISGIYELTAEAEDESGGSGVDFVRFVALYDGAWHDLGDDNTAPYSWSWDTKEIADQTNVRIGLHIVDKAGNKNIGGDGSHTDITIQNSGSAAVDSDNDGLSDAEEAELGTDPQDADSDDDGMPDGWELDHGLNPLDGADSALDADSDGHTNLEEFLGDTDPNDNTSTPKKVSGGVYGQGCSCSGQTGSANGFALFVLTLFPIAMFLLRRKRRRE